MHRPSCWEIMGCGREPGGPMAAELGVCPAAVDVSCDGINHGRNGGRICWAITGTLCEGKPQGTFAQKIGSCKSCEVYRKVRREEGDACVLSKKAGSIAQLKSELTKLSRY